MIPPAVLRRRPASAPAARPQLRRPGGFAFWRPPAGPQTPEEGGPVPFGLIGGGDDRVLVLLAPDELEALRRYWDERDRDTAGRTLG